MMALERPGFTVHCVAEIDNRMTGCLPQLDGFSEQTSRPLYAVLLPDIASRVHSVLGSARTLDRSP